MKKITRRLSVFILASLLFLLSGCSPLLSNNVESTGNQAPKVEEAQAPIEGQAYFDKDQVAQYIHLYQSLPPNYITKDQARDMGWTTEDRDYVVGGDRFGNREGKLPKEKGRQYYEADIQAGYSDNRGPERIVFSDDGLIFYTGDHYETFEQLY